MTITAVIEKNDNGLYQISTDEVVAKCNFGGFGNSVQEAKADFMECIDEMREMTMEEGGAWPDSIDVEFTYDIPSLFNYFDFINVSKFARIVGINESKMRAYRAGVCNASEKTATRILEGIKKLGAEMQTAVL